MKKKYKSNISVHRYLYNFFVTKFGIFSSEKILDNFLLNLFGVQILRIIISKYFLKFRRLFISSYNKNDNDLNFYKKNGYLQIKNFLSKEDFIYIKKDFDQKSENFKSINDDKEQINIVNKYKFEIDKLSKIIKKFLMINVLKI